MKPALVSVLLLVTAVAHAAQTPPPPPSISLQQNAVVVSGFKPGGSVVVYSEAREFDGYRYRFIHRKGLLQDKSGAGQVQYSLTDGTPVNSIWLAVDEATGAYSMAKPSGSPYRELALPPNALRRNGKGDLFKVDLPLATFDLLLVRPGVGAWSGTIDDGGASDDDPHPNGRCAADIAKLSPLGDVGPPPDKFRKDDVLVGIDPVTLRYFVQVVGEP